MIWFSSGYSTMEDVDSGNKNRNEKREDYYGLGTRKSIRLG